MRSDGIALGTYRRLGILCRALAPDEDPGPDIDDLTTDWLGDLQSLSMEDARRREEAERNR